VRLVVEHLDHPVLHRVRAQYGLAVDKGVFNLRCLHLELPTVHRGIKGLAKADRDGSLGPRRVVSEGPAFSPRTRACLADSASEMQRKLILKPLTKPNACHVARSMYAMREIYGSNLSTRLSIILFFYNE
jgi:hypothetical protein